MNSRSTPREQLLQAGSRLLGQIDMTDLARALSISAVVDEAGLSHVIETVKLDGAVAIVEDPVVGLMLQARW